MHKPPGHTTEWAGTLYLLASAACFGSMAIFARAAYASGVDTATLLFLRFTVAALLMGASLWFRGHAVPRGRSLATLVAMGALGYAGQAFCFFTALTLASAGLVALLLYLYPALVALLSWLLLRHPITRVQAAAIFVALVGTALTIGRAGDGRPLGVFFGIMAALIYSVYILVGSRLPKEVTPTASTTVITGAAALTYGGVLAARGWHLPATGTGWLAVLAIAVICTVLAILFFFEGLERVGPVRASVISTVEPVFTIVLAVFLLGEAVTPLRLLGGALILGAVLMLAREGSRRPHAVPEGGP